MVEISIDFETYSECDIKAGFWKYSEHPSTEILCLKYSVDGQQPKEYKYGDSKEVLNNLFGLIQSGCKLRAWNANFERAIWENVAVKKLGWVNVAVEQWIDDMAMAAYYAYPLSLKRCGDALKLEQEHLKDTKGVFLLNKFSKPRKPTKNNPSERTLPTDDPESYQDLLNYCHQDVKSQQAIVARLPKQHLPEHEQEAWTLDSKINSNGILIDLKMAQGAIKLLAQHEENLLQELRTLTDGEVRTAKQRDVAILKIYKKLQYQTI
jgi:DNA polymerase